MKNTSATAPGFKTKLFWVFMGATVAALGFKAWIQSEALADLLFATSGVLLAVSGYRSPIPLNVSVAEAMRRESESAEKDYGLGIASLVLMALSLLLTWVNSS